MSHTDERCLNGWMMSDDKYIWVKQIIKERDDDDVDGMTTEWQ